MKRKQFSSDTGARKKVCRQLFAIIGLRGSELRLCPIEPDGMGELPTVREIRTVSVRDDMQLCHIDGLDGRFDLCGRVFDAATHAIKVGVLRARMQNMALRQQAVDRAAIYAAHTMLPVCRKMWNEDAGCSGIRHITMEWDEEGELILSTVVPSAHVQVPTCAELLWLSKMQRELLGAFVQVAEGAETLCPSLGTFLLYFCYTYGGSEPQELSIDIRTSLEWNRPSDWTLQTTFCISHGEGTALRWTFVRNPLPFSSLAAQISGDLEWNEVRPLSAPCLVFDDLKGHAYGWHEFTKKAQPPSLLLLCIARVRNSIDYMDQLDELPQELRDAVVFGLRDVGLSPLKLSQ